MLPVPESYVGHAAEFYLACFFLLLCSISFPIVIYDYFWFRQWRMRAALHRAYHRGYTKGFRKHPNKRSKLKSPFLFKLQRELIRKEELNANNSRTKNCIS